MAESQLSLRIAQTPEITLLVGINPIGRIPLPRFPHVPETVT
jgi:hypothetical protein